MCRLKNKKIKGREAPVWIEIMGHTLEASRKKFVCLFKNRRIIAMDSVA